MLPTSTHLMPVIGLDLHLATSGNPFHPYIGMVIDPFDYIPFLGSNVNINGLKRGVSDTSGVLITFQHIPLVGAFIMMPIIGHESMNFFSSQTVFAEGTRLSPKGYMVMTCNDVGIPFSGALSKVGKKKFKFTPTLFAPTSFSIPIPTGAPVMVGGPYAPDWGGMLTGLLSSIGFSTLLSFAPAILKAMKKAGKKGGDLSKAYANKARKLMSGVADNTPLPSRKTKVGKPKLPNIVLAKTDMPVKKKVPYGKLGKETPCFLAGTEVLTVAGYKVIESIKFGDQVVTYDFYSNNFVSKRVVNLFKNWCIEYYILNTVDGVLLRVTGNHLFWIENKQCWKVAKQIESGDVLKGRHTFVTVEHIQKIATCSKETYNLEVEDLHCYLVGSNGVLVHNQSRPSKFDVTTTKPTSFYKITGPDGTYIGQTTRTIEERFAEHGLAKGWTRENGWDVEPLGESKHLTPYEAAVWEQHYIEQNGGKDKLLNKRNEITEKKYDAYAHKHNPCK